VIVTNTALMACFSCIEHSFSVTNQLESKFIDGIDEKSKMPGRCFNVYITCECKICCNVAGTTRVVLK